MRLLLISILTTAQLKVVLKKEANTSYDFDPGSVHFMLAPFLCSFPNIIFWPSKVTVQAYLV